MTTGRDWREMDPSRRFFADNPAVDRAGYPMAFNIESDPREMRNVAVENTWIFRPYSESIGAYMLSLREHPNPPAMDLTHF